MVASTSIYSSAQDTQALKAVWETVGWESCPSHYNFHLHTNCSDGQLNPIDLIDQALYIGLKGLAITDHHSLQGYYIAQQYLQEVNQLHLRLWTGIEITSDLGDAEVHLLGYGFDPEHPALIPYIKGFSPQGHQSLAENVIDALHKAGGLVVLAHPERYYKPAHDLVPLGAELGIDGIETYYAYGNPKPWQPTPKKTDIVRSLGESYGLLHTCGTDTHGLSILRRI
ncbi:MAG: PHP domain-containing protein [Microcystaceae cyanobacterium]